MIRKSFSMTATEAQNLSFFGQTRAVGFVMDDAEVRPFRIIWPHEENVAGEISRFRLPGLTFNGKKVAVLGFRNKDGFVMIAPGLPEQVENAISSRFRKMIALARTATRAHKEERRALIAESNALMFGEMLNDDRQALGGFRPEATRENANDLVSAVCARLSSHSGVKFCLTTERQDYGSLKVIMTGPATALSVEMFRISWTPIPYNKTSSVQRVEISFREGIPREPGLRFIDDCRRRAGIDIKKANNLQEMSAADAEKLDEAVRGTHFEYY